MAGSWPMGPWNSGPALYPCGAVGGVMGVCPSSLHVFLWTWRRLTTVFPGKSCRGYCGNMGYLGRFYKPSGPCITKVRAASVYSAHSQTRFQWVLASARVVPCRRSCLRFSWTGSQGAAGGRRVSGFGTSELRLCSLQVMWFCWLDRAVTFSTHWGGLKPSVKLSG